METQTLWLKNVLYIPKGYRQYNIFYVHTYRLYNPNIRYVMVDGGYVWPEGTSMAKIRRAPHDVYRYKSKDRLIKEAP